VVRAVSALVRSHDLAGGVDPIGKGKARARHVERGVVAAINVEQEAVVVSELITVLSDDLAGVVDPIGLGIRAGHVERGVAAINVQQEAVQMSVFCT